MSGFWSGVAAYTIWGLVPIYWKLLKHVPAIQVLGHRIVWSLAVLLILMAGAAAGRPTGAREHLSPRRRPLRDRRGADCRQLVPLHLRGQRRLHRRDQPRLLHHAARQRAVRRRRSFTSACGRRSGWRSRIAAAGVMQLTFAYGALPWIAFGLAASFGSYGLAKKKAPLDPLEGLTLETAILCAAGARVSW